MTNDETYIDTLAQLPGIRYKRLLYGEFLPERDLSEVKNEDILKVMRKTGLSYQVIETMTFDEFQALKQQSR